VTSSWGYLWHSLCGTACWNYILMTSLCTKPWTSLIKTGTFHKSLVSPVVDLMIPTQLAWKIHEFSFFPLMADFASMVNTVGWGTLACLILWEPVYLLLTWMMKAFANEFAEILRFEVRISVTHVNISSPARNMDSVINSFPFRLPSHLHSLGLLGHHTGAQ